MLEARLMKQREQKVRLGTAAGAARSPQPEGRKEPRLRAKRETSPCCHDGPQARSKRTLTYLDSVVDVDTCE